LATSQEERNLLNAFGSMSNDILSGTTPDFVRNLVGPPPSPMNTAPPPPPQKMSSFTMGQQAGMPANVALEAAATGARMSAEGDAQQTVDAEQGSRKNRAKVAARALLMEFPEVALGVPPMPPYSNAIAKYAEEFGISVEEIEGELAGLEGIQGPSLPMTGEGQFGGPEGITTSAMRLPMGMPDIPNIPFGDIASGIRQQVPWLDLAGSMALRNFLPTPRPTPEADISLGDFQFGTGRMGIPTVSFQESAPTGGELPLSPPGSPEWAPPTNYSDFPRVDAAALAPYVDTPVDTSEFPSPSPVPVELPGGEFITRETEMSPEDTVELEKAAGLAAQTDEPEVLWTVQPTNREQQIYASLSGLGDKYKFMREDDPFKDFADPSAAAYESAARGWLGADANRPAYMQAVKRGQTHAMGSFWLNNILDPEGTEGDTYYGYLTEGKHIDPKKTQQIYDSIVRASATAHLSNSLTDWATPAETGLSNIQIETIGEMVRQNPELEINIVAAQYGITGKGYFGNNRLRGLYAMKDIYDRRAIRDPDAEQIGFAAWYEQQQKNLRKRVSAPQTSAQPAAATPQKSPFEDFVPTQQTIPLVT